MWLIASLCNEQRNLLYLLFSFGTFDSFLVGLGRNQVYLYSACCSTQTAHKPVSSSSAKQTTGAKSLLY